MVDVPLYNTREDLEKVLGKDPLLVGTTGKFISWDKFIRSYFENGGARVTAEDRNLVNGEVKEFPDAEAALCEFDENSSSATYTMEFYKRKEKKE